MDKRDVSVRIPLSEVPFVMRAMGFYPSEQEVCKDVLNTWSHFKSDEIIPQKVYCFNFKNLYPLNDSKSLYDIYKL
jgi:hypothetical protein